MSAHLRDELHNKCSILTNDRLSGGERIDAAFFIADAVRENHCPDENVNLTRLLVTRCFGQEPEADVRSYLVEMVGDILFDTSLDTYQAHQLHHQLVSHISTGTEKDSTVAEALHHLACEIAMRGLPVDYADNKSITTPIGRQNPGLLHGDIFTIN